ncbi:TetR/AcrR family transcriptional regulator [Microbacterium terricola]|uniref:HTH tetR-type domain-containing protein n=1 Tax=Microbacterium terricola TaxID=344163 RepID=A0ABM8E1J9_9MICO|nr:TetR/AcrR family transcriptional regulator [Microbacterium terricola]UYK40582.1 TetR/AcrR family transcriptional regulator [Microbacterium terricola]BDV31689.1 hypothetical protein Microterr_23490 [Microbacterium terricola]
MAEADDVELPRGIALAWGVAANPQRGPKREMSVEQIVDAAVEIADAEGLAAVSMAGVAARLGYTPMSLYRYVSAKDDLVLLMHEDATGAPPESVREADGWRAGLEELYRAQLASYHRHPWVLDVAITGSPLTPNGAAWMDAGLRILADTPLTHDERMTVILLVTGAARWAGIVAAGYARSMRETGADAAEITRREDALFRQLVSADSYPDLRAAVDAGVFVADRDPFAEGLRISLDGVADYIADADGRRKSGAVPARALFEEEDAAIAGDKRYREAQRAQRDAEKQLRDARKVVRQVAREARERSRADSR